MQVKTQVRKQQGRESETFSLATDKLGELKIEKEDIILFEDGIFGYEDLKQFVLVNFPDCHPFEWLVSVENPVVAFPVINPIPLFTDYEPLKSIDGLSALEIDVEDKIETFCTVTLGNDPSSATINLKGPILINMGKNKGKQYILTEDYYTVHHPLLRENRNGR